MEPEVGMSIATLATIIGPTLALTVAAAGTAILITHANSLRITILEKARDADRAENATDHREIKNLIIESQNSILQQLRNAKDHH